MSITLSTSRLSVEVALPGEPPNTTFRFDRAGFITSVLLDGAHQFCTREPDNLSHPCSGGVGLCSEFKMDAAAREAPIGGRFIKPGVGLLTKTEESDYIFYKQYEAELFPITWEAGSDMVTFTTAPLACAGYALRQVKRLQVQDTTLTMTMLLENTGEREVELSEYCHNFVSIDALPLGPGYRLAFTRIKPQDGKLSPERNGTFTAGRNIFSFAAYNASAAMAYLRQDDILPGAPFSWELTHTASPASIRETVSFKPDTVAIWAVDHIISPEVFTRLRLRPGESASWTRTWTLNA